MPKTPVGFIFYFVRQQGLAFAFLWLAFVVWGVSDAVYPYCVKRIVNDMALNGSGLVLDLLFLLAVWVLAECLVRAQGVLQIFIFPKLRASIESDTFDYLLGHSLRYFNQQQAGGMAKRLNDLGRGCQTLLEMIFSQFVSLLASVVMVFVLLFVINRWFAFIMLVWLAIHWLITFKFFSRSNALWQAHAQAAAAVSGNVVDVCLGIY